jgi:hypothetical protein
MKIDATRRGSIWAAQAAATRPEEQHGAATMNAKQYREALAKLKLSHQGAADALGISRRQSIRYGTGESSIPEPVARLLRMFIEHGLPLGGSAAS